MSEAIFYLLPGVNVLVKFDDTFYAGKIKDVNGIGHDEHGYCVDCKVEYEDGDVVDNETFYSKDFENDDSEDNWKILPTPTSLLIKTILDYKKELDSLKQKLDDEYEFEEDDDDDDDNVEDEVEDDEFEIEEFEEESKASTVSSDNKVIDISIPKDNIILTIARTAFNITGSLFFGLLTWKIIVD